MGRCSRQDLLTLFLWYVLYYLGPVSCFSSVLNPLSMHRWGSCSGWWLDGWSILCLPIWQATFFVHTSFFVEGVRPGEVLKGKYHSSFSKWWNLPAWEFKWSFTVTELGMSRLGSPSLLFSFLDCSACNLQGCDAPREAIKHAWEQREWAWSWKTSHGRGRLTWELKGSRCFHHIRKERRKNIPEIKKVCEQRHRARQEEPPRAGLLGEWRLPPFASPERLR